MEMERSKLLSRCGSSCLCKYTWLEIECPRVGDVWVEACRLRMSRTASCKNVESM